jgi:hypothetical protein
MRSETGTIRFIETMHHIRREPHRGGRPGERGH